MGCQIHTDLCIEFLESDSGTWQRPFCVPSGVTVTSITALLLDGYGNTIGTRDGGESSGTGISYSGGVLTWAITPTDASLPERANVDPGAAVRHTMTITVTGSNNFQQRVLVKLDITRLNVSDEHVGL